MTLKLILVHMINMYKQQTCMHQGDPCFGDSSGTQCVANCTVFFTMKLLLESRKQTICKMDLDNIIMLGSMLYSSLYADSGIITCPPLTLQAIWKYLIMSSSYHWMNRYSGTYGIPSLARINVSRTYICNCLCRSQSSFCPIIKTGTGGG